MNTETVNKVIGGSGDFVRSLDGSYGNNAPGKKSIEKRGREDSVDRSQRAFKKPKLTPSERIQKDLCDSITQENLGKFRSCLAKGADINRPLPGKEFYPAELAAIVGTQSKMFAEVMNLGPILGQIGAKCIGTSCLATSIHLLDISAVDTFLKMGASLGTYPYWGEAPYLFAADFNESSGELKKRKQIYLLVEEAAKLREDYLAPPEERDAFIRGL